MLDKMLSLSRLVRFGTQPYKSVRSGSNRYRSVHSGTVSYVLGRSVPAAGHIRSRPAGESKIDSTHANLPHSGHRGGFGTGRDECLCGDRCAMARTGAEIPPGVAYGIVSVPHAAAGLACRHVDRLIRGEA